MYTQIISHPKCDFSRLDPTCREEGLSGFMRLRNEEDFLAQTIESWLPELDELVIVYNNCQDRTPEIVEDYARRYPEKIKAFHYLPIVSPQGSEKHITLSPNDEHSLVHYYNFAYLQTTKKWCVKVDGDLILPKANRGGVKRLYNQLLSHWQVTGEDKVIRVAGINIVDHQGKLFVNKNFPFCGTGGDHVIFRVEPKCYFIHHRLWEVLDIRHKNTTDSTFLYYHLKYMKSDYGIGNFNFKENPTSDFYIESLFNIRLAKLVPLETYLPETGMPKVSLQDFHLTRQRDWKKEAMAYLRTQGGKFSWAEFMRGTVNFLLYAYVYRSRGYLYLRKLKRYVVGGGWRQ